MSYRRHKDNYKTYIRKNVTEADIAKVVVEHFRSIEFNGLKYEVFSEVKTDDSPIDIVLRLNNEEQTISAIECKKSCNLTLIIQALKNRDYCNMSFICFLSYGQKNMRTILDMCQMINIGLITIDTAGDVKVRFHPKVTKAGKEIKLYEEQKDYAQAGATKQKLFTPFKKTLKNMAVYIDENGATSLRKVVRNIEHHYANDRSAIGALRNCLRRKEIKGLYYDEQTKEVKTWTATQMKPS